MVLLPLHLNLEDGEIIVPVALATETDIALEVVANKSYDLGLASESDSAFAVDFIKAFLVGLAEETDSAFAVTHDRAFEVGLAEETDSAFPLTYERTYHLGLAEETDSAGRITILEDSFTEATDTDLDLHDPEIGGPWSGVSSPFGGYPAHELRIDGATDRVRMTVSFTTSSYRIPEVYTDVDVTLVMYTNDPSSGSCAVMVRCPSESEFTGLWAGWGTGNELYLLNKVDGESDGVLYNESANPATPLSRTLRLKVEGSRVRLWKDDIGDEDSTVYDGTPTISASGFIVLRQQGSTANTPQADWLQVKDLTRGLAENLEREAVYTREPSDSFTFTETLARDLVLTRLLADDISGLAENLQPSFIFGRILSDNLTLTDALTRELVLTRLVSDALTLVDTLTYDLDSVGGATVSRNLKDQLNLVDTLLRGGEDFNRELSDALTLTDTLIRALIKQINLSEAFTLTDTLERTFDGNRVLSDSFSLTDALARELDLTREVTDDLTLVDTLLYDLFRGVLLSDNLTLTENLVRDGTFTRNVRDAIILSEDILASVNDAPLLAENLRHWRWWYWREIRRQKPYMESTDLWG